MTTQQIAKVLYRPTEIQKMGYPSERVMELARKVNRKSDPTADRGFHYLLTLEEVKKHFGY